MSSSKSDFGYDLQISKRQARDRPPEAQLVLRSDIGFGRGKREAVLEHGEILAADYKVNATLHAK